MKQCIALAALVCLMATGCAQMRGSKGCGEACHVATSRRAPRPLLTRDASRPSGRVFKNHGCGCEGCDQCSACSDGGCCLDGGCIGGGMCNACGECDGCRGGGPCQRMAERLAGGGCGPCGACGVGGLCPNNQSYPEQPMYNAGPPTGQVAYPYYTVRGPRDFLAKNPPNIGPY